MVKQITGNEGKITSQAAVVHHIPGRLRVRVEAAKRNPEHLERMREAISKIEGVLDVSANPALGTLIILYQPKLFREVVQRLNELGSKMQLFSVRDQEPELTPPVTQVDRALDNFVAKVNTGLGALTGETVNLKEIFPFGLVLYSVLFVDKAIAAAQWLSWLQFAFSTYMELHQEEPVAKVGKSVEALRAEERGLRDELLGLLKKDSARDSGQTTTTVRTEGSDGSH